MKRVETKFIHVCTWYFVPVYIPTLAYITIPCIVSKKYAFLSTGGNFCMFNIIICNKLLPFISCGCHCQEKGKFTWKVERVENFAPSFLRSEQIWCVQSDVTFRLEPHFNFLLLAIIVYEGQIKLLVDHQILTVKHDGQLGVNDFDLKMAVI